MLMLNTWTIGEVRRIVEGPKSKLLDDGTNKEMQTVAKHKNKRMGNVGIVILSNIAVVVLRLLECQ